MDDEKDINAQQKIARELGEDRRALLQQVPFGKELERDAHDLERLALPVVAVAGAYSVGKSALINTLAGTDKLPIGVTPTTLVPVILRGGETESCLIRTAEGTEPRPAAQLRTLVTAKDSPARYVILETPQLMKTPWQWLDVPGTNTDAQKKLGIDLQPRELADICILATSALQPLSLTDLTQLVQLSENFEDTTLCIVLTRSDQLSKEELASTQEYTRKMLADVLPGRALKLFSVSSRTRMGLNELQAHLSSTVYKLQKTRLKAELESWTALLEELEALLEMRELSRVRPETIRRIHTRLDALVTEAGVRLRNELPQLVESALAEFRRKLPAPQRELAAAFRVRMEALLRPRLHDIRQRLEDELKRELQQDLPEVISGKFLSRFPNLLFPTKPLLDESQALTSLGFGAGALLGASSGLAGILVGGFMGGLLGGLMGNLPSIDTADELRERLAVPFTRDFQTSLRQFTDSARYDIAHLCLMITKVTKIFSRPEASAYDPTALKTMQRVVGMAKSRLKNLQQRFDDIEKNRKTEQMLAAMKAMQSVPKRPSSSTKSITRSKPKSRGKRG